MSRSPTGRSLLIIGICVVVLIGCCGLPTGLYLFLSAVQRAVVEELETQREEQDADDDSVHREADDELLP